ncbi:PPC domain-containing DNA-binding protein [Peribacillus alkalitolerans]|uniref:PPC domain-containing DNA-binding protein n=1 Tax=Peribacillus alkalitolerans TaxID=1550385 RepID=UPI0013D3CDF0|nr:PPC domain-containing DNA-binding protein [Peribacillus alkalitolerans]
MTRKIRAHYATGSPGKIVAARLLPGTDLLTGIEEICRENSIKSASITNCFGSFQSTGFLYLVPKPESSIGAGYSDLIGVEGPIELLNGTGVVCQRDDQYELHVHGTMCDKEGRVFGGHLVKGENPVITVDMVITEIKEMNLYRKFDEETGGNQFYPVKKGESYTTVIEN